jgi:DNA repair exonuclease SbcCD ATPase subunit
LLQSQTIERRQEQSQAEALEKQTVELHRQLSEKIAEQQRWRQRESELEHSIGRQKGDLANSAAAARIQEVELRRLKGTIDDLRVIESALCARVRELSTQEEAQDIRNDELHAQIEEAMQTIRERDQELAVLRHSILEAARIGNHLSHERAEVDCQVVDGWKRLITALLQTTLSSAQRGLITQITCALEGWKNGRAEATRPFECHIEPPDLHESEFNCSELVESALADVRKHADKSGVKIQTEVVGLVPANLRGNAQNIQQLITVLGTSLAQARGAENLQIQVSFESKRNGAAEMLLSILLSSTHSDEMCLRLASLAKESSSIWPAKLGQPQLAFASVWQLALGLGGRPSVETAADQKVHVKIMLPLQPALSPVAERSNGTADILSA